MVRKLVSTLALGATLVGVAGSQVSAQPATARLAVAVPPVYVGVGVVAGSPGPGWVWVPRLNRWCWVGPGYAPAYWPAPAPYVYAPRPFVYGPRFFDRDRFDRDRFDRDRFDRDRFDRDHFDRGFRYGR